MYNYSCVSSTVANSFWKMNATYERKKVPKNAAFLKCYLQVKTQRIFSQELL